MPRSSTLEPCGVQRRPLLPAVLKGREFGFASKIWHPTRETWDSHGNGGTDLGVASEAAMGSGRHGIWCRKRALCRLCDTGGWSSVEMRDV
jgi:hypothetical protein